MRITSMSSISFKMQGSPSFVNGRNHSHTLIAARPHPQDRNEGLTLDALRNSKYR